MVKWIRLGFSFILLYLAADIIWLNKISEGIFYGALIVLGLLILWAPLKEKNDIRGAPPIGENLSQVGLRVVSGILFLVMGIAYLLGFLQDLISSASGLIVGLVGVLYLFSAFPRGRSVIPAYT